MGFWRGTPPTIYSFLGQARWSRVRHDPFASSRPQNSQGAAKDRDQQRLTFAGNASAVEGGAALYKDHCLQCHGRDLSGDGKRVPSLKTSGIRNASDGDLEWFLHQGDLRHGMPSWSGLPLAKVSNHHLPTIAA